MRFYSRMTGVMPAVSLAAANKFRRGAANQAINVRHNDFETANWCGMHLSFRLPVDGKNASLYDAALGRSEWQAGERHVNESSINPSRDGGAGYRTAENGDATVSSAPERIWSATEMAQVQQALAQLRQDREHRERQIEAIRKTSDALFSHPSVDAMVRATLQIALEVLRADAGTVFLHDSDSDTLVFRYVIGPAADQLMGKSFPASQGIAGTVFRTSRPTLTGNVAKRDDFNKDVDKETGYLTESMMTVPVKRSDGDPIGVMQILNAQSPPFDERDLEVLEVLCAQAATGIEHAKLVEEARRAQVVHVIGDISHDIKNFMTPISSGVMTFQPMVKELFDDLDAIRVRCDDPAVKQLADDIERATAGVRGVYDWMLESFVSASDKAQARAKEIADAIKGEIAPPFFEEANVNMTAREVVVTLRAVGEKNLVHLVEDFDPAIPLAQFDKKQMFNALYNLVNNAIPFTPAGGSVTVRTRPFPAEQNPTHLEIVVADTGVGMPEHVRLRLFTAGAISTSQHGTGLGTRIVGDVVKRHNGTITVDSVANEGSTFTVRIPLRHENSGRVGSGNFSL